MKQPTTSQLFSIDPWYPWFKLSLCHRPCPYGPRSPVVHRPKSPQKHRRWPAHLRHSSVKARGWDPIAGVGTYEGVVSRGDTPFFNFSTETNGDLGIPQFKKPPSYSFMCVSMFLSDGKSKQIWNSPFLGMENQKRSEITHEIPQLIRDLTVVSTQLPQAPRHDSSLAVDRSEGTLGGLDLPHVSELILHSATCKHHQRTPQITHWISTRWKHCS